MTIAELTNKIGPKTKEYAGIAVIGLVVFGIGFGTGRRSAPTKVVEHEKTQVVTMNEDILKEIRSLKTSLQEALDAYSHLKLHIETTTVKAPDGTVTTHRTEDKNVDTAVHKKVTQTQTQVVTVEKETIRYQDKVVEKYKLVESKQPDWRVAALVGTNVTHLKLLPSAPYLNPIEFGGELDRHLFNFFGASLWGGLYLMSSGSVGLSLSAQF